MSAVKQTLKDIFAKQSRDYRDMWMIKETIASAGLGPAFECGHADQDSLNALASLIRKTDDAETKAVAQELHTLIKTKRFLAP